MLLVSHNIRQVDRMCSRVMLMSRGAILHDGDPRSTCDRFYQLSNQIIHEQKAKDTSRRIVSSGEAKDIEVEVLNPDGCSTAEIREGDTLRIRIRFRLERTISDPEFHIGTHTTDFVYLTGESTAVLGAATEYRDGVHEIEHIIPAYPLVPGTYGIRFAIIDRRGRVVFHGESLKFFDVIAGYAYAPTQDELRLVAVPVQWVLKGETISPRRNINLLSV